MKKLIYLFALLSFQLSLAQTWEPTSWQMEPRRQLFNSPTESIIIAPEWNGYTHQILQVTRDNGENWNKVVIDSLKAYFIEPVILGNNIFVSYKHYDSKGCYVSRDLGKTWINEIQGILVKEKRVKIKKVNDKIIAFIYGSTESGLLFSTDEGSNWVNKTLSLGPVNFTGFTQSENYTIVQTETSQYISSNYGDTWNEISNPPVNADSIQIFGDRLFAFKYGPEYQKFYLYISTDQGKTWSDIASKVPEGNIPNKLQLGQSCIFLTSSNIQSKKYGLLISTDYGNTWNEKSFECAFNGAVNLALSYADRLIYCDKNGIWATSDYGVTWINGGKNLPLVPWNRATLVKSSNAVYANFGNDVFRSIDSCKTWQLWYNGGEDHDEVYGINTVNDTLYLSSYIGVNIDSNSVFNSVFKSVDNGITWSSLGLQYIRVSPIRYALFLGEGKVVAHSKENILITSDNGLNWEDISQLWPNNSKFDYAVFQGGLTYTGMLYGGIKESNSESDVWIERNNGLPDIFENKLYDLKEADGFFYTHVGDSYYISSDKGLNWEIRNNGIEPLWGDSVCFDAKENEIYISHQTNLYYSNDNGLNWKKRDLSSMLNSLDFVIAIKIVEDKIIISLSQSGLFISSDKGISWKNLNEGLEGDTHFINHICYNNEYIFCSKMISQYTLHHDLVYLYRMKRSDLGVGEPEKKSPNGFSIFPNPASDYLLVKDYEGGATEFAVTNVLGNTILSGSYTGGRLEISSLPAGTYFLRLGNTLGKFVKK